MAGGGNCGEVMAVRGRLGLWTLIRSVEAGEILLLVLGNVMGVSVLVAGGVGVCRASVEFEDNSIRANDKRFCRYPVTNS